MTHLKTLTMVSTETEVVSRDSFLDKLSEKRYLNGSILRRVTEFLQMGMSPFSPPAQAIYLSAAFTSPSKKLKVFWMMEKIMLNKYLFVCHVGCGPFPQKTGFSACT